MPIVMRNDHMRMKSICGKKRGIEILSPEHPVKTGVIVIKPV